MSKETVKTLKNVAIFFVVVAGLIFGGLKLLGSNSKTLVETNPDDWMQGGGNAGVTVIEYSDFQCPACGAYYPLIKQIQSDFGEDLKFVYRHYPLTTIHKNSMTASKAAEAAGLQGKFWEMHDLLFEGQKDWTELDDPTEKFVEYATSLELDTEKFKSDLESDEVYQNVKDDLDSALSLGLNSTPSFFMDGVRITNPKDYNAFKALIEKKLNK